MLNGSFKGKSKKIIAAVTAASVMLPLTLFQRPKVVALSDYEYLVQIRFASEEELEERRNDRDDAMARAQAAAQRVSELRSQMDELTGQIGELEALETERQGEYQMLESQYAAACLAKAQALDEYVEAQENLEEAQLMFQERLSVMFEFQNKSYLQILLESDSLAGFFTNIEIISLIADADNQAVESMENALTVAQLASDYALAQADLAQQAADEKLEELEALEEEIGIQSSNYAALSAQLTQAQSEEGQFNSLVSSLNSEIEQMQNEIIAQYNIAPSDNVPPEAVEDITDVHVNPGDIPSDDTQTTQETEAATTETSETSDTTESSETGDTETYSTDDPEETAFEVDTPTETPTPTPEPTTAPAVITTAPATTTTGQLQWPTWSRSVGSEFGYRIHPIYGDQRFHNGIDIENGFGDTICAAASGTVSYVEYPCPDSNTGGSGYGNYLIIDHGNGLCTLYAHCQSIYVNSGDYVSCGQAIATVGSTGGSTGAHLHFEVRSGGPWGTPVDPRAYLVR